MTNGKPVYATASKTLKVVLCTNICPACDKQLIASALVQLKINCTCIFKVFQIALVDSGNFEKTLKMLVKLILNCPRAHAITYTNKVVKCILRFVRVFMRKSSIEYDNFKCLVYFRSFTVLPYLGIGNNQFIKKYYMTLITKTQKLL